MNVCMRHNKQTNMVITSQANLIALACYGNVAIFFFFFLPALLCSREMLPILVPVPHATGAVGGSPLAEQGGRGGAGGVLWGGARRGGAGLFILGAMLLFFLFSFVFLSPLLIEVRMLLMNRKIIQWLLQVLLGRSLHFFITIKKLGFFSF